MAERKVIERLRKEGTLLLYYDFRSGTGINLNYLGNYPLARAGSPSLQSRQGYLPSNGGYFKATHDAGLVLGNFSAIVLLERTDPAATQCLLSKVDGAGTAWEFSYNGTTNALTLLDEASSSTYTHGSELGQCLGFSWGGAVSAPHFFSNGIYIGDGTTDNTGAASAAADLYLGYQLADVTKRVYSKVQAVLLVATELPAVDHESIYAELMTQRWASPQRRRINRNIWRSDFGYGSSGVSLGGTAHAQLGDTTWRSGDALVQMQIQQESAAGERKCNKRFSCAHSGLIYTSTASDGLDPSMAAYGKWSFWAYKEATIKTMLVAFIANQPVDPSNAAFNGYYFALDTLDGVNGLLTLQKSTGGVITTLMMTRADYFLVAHDWFHVDIERSPLGVFTVYLSRDYNSPSFHHKVILPTAGGLGTNPATDNDHTSSNYIVVTMMENDALLLGDHSGRDAFTKY